METGGTGAKTKIPKEVMDRIINKGLAAAESVADYTGLRILIYLSEHGEKASATELGEEFHLGENLVVGPAEALAKRGFIVETWHSFPWVYELTPKGEKILDALGIKEEIAQYREKKQ